MAYFTKSDDIKLYSRIKTLLKKEAQTTTPYYKGECPESGETIYITPSALVQGKGGKIDCPEGPRKLKNIRPASLADKLFLSKRDKKKKKSSGELILSKRAGNLKDFAQEELERAGLFDKDSDYGGMIGKAIMEMIETFRGHGHSGGSAFLMLEILPKLLNYKTLTECPHDKINDMGDISGPGTSTEMCDHCMQIWFDGEEFDMSTISAPIALLKKYSCHDCYMEGAEQGLSEREMDRLISERHPGNERKRKKNYFGQHAEKILREVLYPKYDVAHMGYSELGVSEMKNMTDTLEDVDPHGDTGAGNINLTM